MTLEERNFHREHALKNKADILKQIEKIEVHFRVEYCDDEESYNRQITTLSRFRDEISGIEILEIPDEYWHYRISVRETEIILFLDHSVVRSIPFSENRFYLDNDQHVIFHETKAEMVSAEEFGRLHDVPSVTVRQWIRRGKLHSAEKAAGL